jgi:deoxyribose-phosphate aldolase
MPEDIRYPVWEQGQSLASFIDFTMLKAEARSAELSHLCEEASAYGFHSVCVSGGWVRLCRERLSGTSVKVSAVVGFPLGAHATRAKAFEAAAALEDGASEIDMVLPLGRLLDGDYEAAERDIAAVVQAVQGGALVKVILETGLLTDELKAAGGKIAEAAGADYIQTSTGFGGDGGATEADIRLLRASVSASMGVKASGGIRDAKSAMALLKAGANRIGSSSGIAIVRGFI